MRPIMATTASPIAYGAEREKAAPTENFFARIINRIVEARMKKARMEVNSYLSQLSDERLADLGISTDHAKALRNKNQIPASYLS